MLPRVLIGPAGRRMSATRSARGAPCSDPRKTLCDTLNFEPSCKRCQASHACGPIELLRAHQRPAGTTLRLAGDSRSSSPPPPPLCVRRTSRALCCAKCGRGRVHAYVRLPGAAHATSTRRRHAHAPASVATHACLGALAANGHACGVWRLARERFVLLHQHTQATRSRRSKRQLAS